jgi:hypothetical protein
LTGRSVEDVSRQLAIARGSFDEVEGPALGARGSGVVGRGSGFEDLPHLGKLPCQQRAKDGAYVYAGEEVACAPGSSGRAGVVAMGRMIEREVHVLRDADRTVTAYPITNQRPESVHGSRAVV